MKGKKRRWGFLYGCLAVVIVAGAAHAGRDAGVGGVPSHGGTLPSGGGVSVSASLVRDKVYAGGSGEVSLELTLAAAEGAGRVETVSRGVDMVIILDRSGSMQGEKIADARQAVAALIARLSAADRFALVSYSDGVRIDVPLGPVTARMRGRATAVAAGISAGGGTNLGAGLQAGIDTLLSGRGSGNAGRVILISDGRANQGIVDPHALSGIAAAAARRECVVSTVGVGADFNELLMTRLADHGTGSYHFLEDPQALAGIFLSEFRAARMVCAEGVEVSVPLSGGIALLGAAGYPVTVEGTTARFYPGTLLAGQVRRLFLHLRVPVGTERVYDLGGIEVRYLSRGRWYRAGLPAPLAVACVSDSAEAEASLRKEVWEKKVIQADYGRLREEVASDIRKGRQREALERIDRYREEKAARNRSVGSEEVSRNLETDLEKLRDTVEETFSGAPATVRVKRKRNAKALQYEGYRGKREGK